MKRDANILETQLRVLAIQMVSMTNLPFSKSNLSLCSLLIESNADECKVCRHSQTNSHILRELLIRTQTLSETWINQLYPVPSINIAFTQDLFSF